MTRAPWVTHFGFTRTPFSKSIPAKDLFTRDAHALGTFSSRFTELVGMPPSTYRRHAARATAGIPSCVAKQVTRPIRNREARTPEPQLA